MRKQFVDDMKRIGAPNLRWPGGCFADGYHWRDGIGPAAKRPAHLQLLGKPHASRHARHGNESVRRARVHAAVPPGWRGTLPRGQRRFGHAAGSFTTGSRTATRRRARRVWRRSARPTATQEPFGVKYWGVGNESLGLRRRYEAGRIRRRSIATSSHSFRRMSQPFLVATGPRGHSRDMDLGWTNGFFEAMQGGHRSRAARLLAALQLRIPQQPQSGSPTSTLADWYAVLLRRAAHRSGDRDALGRRWANTTRSIARSW